MSEIDIGRGMYQGGRTPVTDYVDYVVDRRADEVEKKFEEQFGGHIRDKNNPHETKKEQLGLGNVDAPDSGKVQIGAGASAVAQVDGTSVAVGKDAKASSFLGVAIGQGASSSSLGAAVGAQASVDGPGGAVGYQAKAGNGGAVGVGAEGGSGFAGGMNAKTKETDSWGCIQLGTGTNVNNKTLQVYSYQLLDADGHIPPERLKNIDVPDDGSVAVGAGAAAAADMDGTSVAIGKDASAVQSLGVAVGQSAKTSAHDSVAVGRSASAAGPGAAIGAGASVDDYGGAVGWGAKSSAGGAVGYQASAHSGGAVGRGAKASSGFAGGYNANAGSNNFVDCIQLGTGTNANEKTLQVYDYQLLDADGHIPPERMDGVVRTVNHAAPDADGDVTVSSEVKNVSAPDDGSVAVGAGAKAAADLDGTSVAIGKDANASSYYGVAVGQGATSSSLGAAVGADANVSGMGGAVGFQAKASSGGAVGWGAEGGSGFAGGMNAKTKESDSWGCIQLGTGTNVNNKTLQVYDYQLLDADGHIPPERIGQKGTWTPAIISSTTSGPTIAYNKQEGDYIRIGDMVWCFFTIWLKSVSGGSESGNIVLGGLPFTPYGGSLGKVVDNKTYVAYLNAASGAVGYEFLMSETGGVALIKRAAGGNTYCTWASDSGILNDNTEFAGIVCYHI